MRDDLRKHGDTVADEFPSIDAVAGVVHSHDIDVLAANRCVKTISADADVEASNSIWLRRADTDAARPSQTLISTLRDTLGLPHNAWSEPSVPTGLGIGVAIIDSGISPSEIGRASCRERVYLCV